jgi:ParB-like chromosome segregation protein Spo0J
VNIVNVDISTLNNSKYNPRINLKSTDKEYIKLKNSIEHFGYVEPLVVNKRNNIIIGGHQRLKVLKDLGYKNIDIVYVDLNDADEKALNIALNKISGDWDAEKLEDLLRELNLDNSIDIELTGFDKDEIDKLFNNAMEELNNTDDISDDKHIYIKIGTKFKIEITKDQYELISDLDEKQIIDRLING